MYIGAEQTEYSHNQDQDRKNAFFNKFHLLKTSIIVKSIISYFPNKNPIPIKQQY